VFSSVMSILLCTVCIEFNHFFFDVLAIVYISSSSSGAIAAMY
jgi:hypothetical protein